MASAPDVRAERAGGLATPPAPSPSDVSERLRSIAINAGAPEEALEPALQAILEACGAGAGAVCLFDQRTEMLRLATEFGLSDEGCQRLRSVRRGDTSAWDMPLHGLLNRRAYLIDSASKNRYVPPLVTGSVRTVACLPLYSGPTPLGSIVLIAVAPRMLGERDIRGLEPPLRELVKIIEAVRRRSRAGAAAANATAAPAPVKLSGQATARETATRPAPAEATPAAPPPLPRPATPTPAATALRPIAVDLLSDTPGRSADTGDRPPGDGERVELLIASLAATERERARLAAALEAERAEHAQQHRAQTALEEHRVAERAGEVERLTTRLAGAEAELARERERVGDWERKFEAMSEELRTAAAREQSVRAELSAAAQRGRAATQQEVAQAVERLRLAEEARVAAEAATAAARAALATAEARNGELEAQLTQLRAQVESLEAAAGADDGSDAEAHRRIDALEREITSLREERDRMMLATRERDAATETERAALRTAQAELEAERQRLAAEAAVAAEARAAVAAAAPEPARIESPPAAEPPPAAPTAAATPRPEATRPTIAVLDVDGTWESLAVKGHRVVVVNAESAAAEHLATLAPARVVVNLAAPGVLAALSALRAAGCTSRFWGCIGARGTKRAIPLGMVEPGVRPLAAETVLAALGGYATRGTRVVTTGGDVDALMSLRQAMARQGMSVSMAWDAKQAADLLVMVKPQVVVIDLESPREGYSVVAALSAGDPVPHALLIPGSGDPAVGFAPVLTDPHYADRFAPLDRLLQNVLRANEGPASERR